jgi:DNA polymerase
MIPCEVCPRRYRPLPPDGPSPAPVLIIGERPGGNENKYGRVFIGKTGEELNATYLPLAGLSRSEVRITNTVLCWADANRTPTPREIDCCSAHHLPKEIQRTDPSLIILMGGSACRLVPSIKLDMHHGIPQWGELYDYRGWIVPMYHPALGLHESRWMTQLLEDWGQLNKRRVESTRDKKPYPTDYKIADTPDEVSAYLRSADTSLLSIDTEDHGGVPWSVQFSIAPGSARLIRATHEDPLETLNHFFGDLWDFEAVLHFAVHDLDVLAKMGIHPPRFRDTLQEAFHLGNLPQGLKPLVYRLFGFTMTSWDDVVRPYSIEALVCWLVEALDIARADLSLIDVVRLKTKIRETVKKGPLEQLINRLLQHTDKSSDYDPWERLDEFWSDDANHHAAAHIEARIGRYPILGIANAPLAKAVTYACGDADWTGQTAVELERRRRDRFFEIADEDRDT